MNSNKDILLNLKVKQDQFYIETNSILISKLKLNLASERLEQIILLNLTKTYFDDGTLSLENLLSDFEAICIYQKKMTLTNELQIQTENHKRNIILAVSQYISNSPENTAQQIETESKKTSKIKKYLKYLLFGTLAVGGIFLDATGNFLAANAIFTVVAFIPSLIVLYAAIGVALINSILFLAFDTQILAKMFKLPLFKTGNPLLDIYENQIKTTKEINQVLLTKSFRNDLTTAQISALRKITLASNDDLFYKSNNIPAYKEKPLKKLGRYFISAFGMLTMVGGSLFFSQALLSLIAVGLLGTPAGWAIIGGCMAISAAYYISKGIRNLYSLMNPDDENIKNTKRKLTSFVQNNRIDSTTFENLDRTKPPSRNFLNFQRTLLKQRKASNQSSEHEEKSLQIETAPNISFFAKRTRSYSESDVIEHQNEISRRVALSN